MKRLLLLSINRFILSLTQKSISLRQQAIQT
jgi:hypothetical protein